ncbi:MAG: bile acid:sodium symporter family protein, partial [Bifidobacterium crudilactis]|nr:bile acid:sodium symporter family protein [Bifidobacterium crudilactis]
MSRIVQFGTWLTRWFTVVVVVWAIINFFLPQTSMWAKSYTNYFLSIILFGMGMTLSIDDFKRIVKMPLMVIVGTIAHYVIMPLLAVALCRIFQLDGMIAVGVILVGCCPSGTSSNVMSFLSRGDVALDVSIGLLSTLCAPIMVPLLMSGLASQYVQIPVTKLFLTALEVVLIPVA